MKKLSAVLLSASFLTLAASAAQAEENRWPNWYIGLHGALTFVGEEDIDDNLAVSGLDADSGWAYGATVGYRPPSATGEWSNMRMEVEWHVQDSDIDKIQTPTGGIAGTGSVRVNAGLFNVFYDAVTSMPEWRPYVGVGVGFASMNLKNTNAAFVSGGDSDTVFAWDMQAGLSYLPQWLPYTEWTLGYRYFATSDAKFGYATGGKYSVEYDSHNIEAGVRFLF